MDSFESQLRFGMTLSNLSHNEHDSTFHGNRFLKNIVDRAQIELKKKSTSSTSTSTTTTAASRTNSVPTNGIYHRFYYFSRNTKKNFNLSL